MFLDSFRNNGWPLHSLNQYHVGLDNLIGNPGLEESLGHLI